MPDIRIWQVFVLSLVVLWAGILVGVWTRSIRADVIETESKVLTVLEGALLTLFGLLMGFTFSMAVNRYDMRKLLVVTEANAIGTTWLRTATLPDPLRTEQQSLLRQYVRARILYHTELQEPKELAETQEQIDKLQAQMWAGASNYAVDHREAITSLYLQTLNQSIDVAAERAAADANRIPLEAWVILLFVGFMSTIVVGTKMGRDNWLLQSILPVVLATTLALTLDLDSPKFGFIRIDHVPIEKVVQDMGRLPQQAP